MLPTDEQVQTYLLCDDCEEILNSGGERWVVSRLLTVEKRFPLYDLLTQQKPDFSEDGFLVYFAAQNPQIDTDKLMHFALGVFWKASVHSWDPKETDPLIELGPYSEKIRLWLRGEGESLSTSMSLPSSLARRPDSQAFAIRSDRRGMNGDDLISVCRDCCSS